MEITCYLSNRNLIAEIDGDIDHHSAEIIRERLEREFAWSGAKNIIFNLSGVSFMDSSGIGMIIGRYKTLRKQGGCVVVVGISAQVSRIFEISGLYKLVQVYGDVKTAETNLR